MNMISFLVYSIYEKQQIPEGFNDDAKQHVRDRIIRLRRENKKNGDMACAICPFRFRPPLITFILFLKENLVLHTIRVSQTGKENMKQRG